MINLHIHTDCSDGLNSPDEILTKINGSKIDFFSITDHDTVDAYKNIKDSKLINGVELSAEFPTGTCHILGYGVNIKIIEKFCLNIRTKRIAKGQKMVEILNNLGYKVNINTKNKIIGRRDLCNYLINNNYFKTYDEAKNELFIKDKPCYIKIEYPKIEECINIIHKAKGLAIIAHPWTLNLSNTNLEKFLEYYNFDGIEVFNHNINNNISQQLIELAHKNNLYITCGTDYHGYKDYNDIIVKEKIDCNRILKKIKGNNNL